MTWRLLAVGFAMVVAVAAGRALVDQDWSMVPVLLRQQDRSTVSLLLTGALVSAAAGPLLGMLAWRTILLELGPPVSLVKVMRIFLVGYLAKYVPGKVPGMVATAKVATAAGVGLPRFIGAGVLTMALVYLTGLVVGLLAAVEVLGHRAGWLVLAAVPLLALVASPAPLTWLARTAARLLRRPPPTRSPSARGLRWAVACQTLSWPVAGLHLWLLAVAMGAPPARSLLLCVGGFSLASVVGMVAVFTPDGLGVREAVLLAALALVLPLPMATIVTLASRLVTTVAEVALGAAALTVVEFIHRRKPGVVAGEVDSGG